MLEHLAGRIHEWTGRRLQGLLLQGLAYNQYRLLKDSDSATLSLATVFGILATVTNFLGFIRWVFVVPHLATRYVDPATSQASKDAIEVVFEAFHLYAGFSIGEHLGYIFIGMWALLTGMVMLRSALFRPWLGWIGIIAGPLVIFGSVEGAGLAVAADINVIGFAVWSLWLIATGVSLLMTKPAASQQRSPAVSRVSATAG